MMSRHYMTYPVRPLVLEQHTTISADPVLCGACPWCRALDLSHMSCTLFAARGHRLTHGPEGVERSPECLNIGDRLNLTEESQPET